MSAAMALAWLAGGMGLGAFIVYACQAAMARDWRAAGAYVIVLMSVLAVGFVALWFN